jgi:endonuclease III
VSRPPAALHGLARQVAVLEAYHGPPALPPVTDPFQVILWENCAYLVDDARRAEVFRALGTEVGLTPDEILATPRERLARVIEAGGMQSERRAEKLHDAAALAAEVGLAALKQLIRESPDKARRVLKKFPGIGDPSADHILLLSHAMVSLAPESNALRVLLRLGYGSERGDYAAQYRSVAKAVGPELKTEWRWLEKARSLLRTHGQELCRRAAPQCEMCPLTSSCRWFLSRRRPG